MAGKRDPHRTGGPHHGVPRCGQRRLAEDRHGRALRGLRELEVRAELGDEGLGPSGDCRVSVGDRPRWRTWGSRVAPNTSFAAVAPSAGAHESRPSSRCEVPCNRCLDRRGAGGRVVAKPTRAKQATGRNANRGADGCQQLRGRGRRARVLRSCCSSTRGRAPKGHGAVSRDYGTGRGPGPAGPN